MEGKTTNALWQDYRFLTKEMMKFLTQQDMELFHNLMNQRERLQTIINQTDDNGFKTSPEGKRILAEIQQYNQNLIQNMQMHLNRSKRHHQVSEAYGGLNAVPASRMSWKR